MAVFVVLVVTLVATAAAGVLWRARRGRLRSPGPRTSEVVLDHATLRALGVEPGRRATLLQFSSHFCAPCRATRRILNEVAGMVEGVAYGEIDAEAHLDTVRRLKILRTPTTFVLDDTGRVVVRASGQPRKPDVLAALGRVVSS